MVIDSSAIIAIVCDEPDARVYAYAIEKALAPVIPAPTFLEVAIVTDGRGPTLSHRFDRFIATGKIAIEPLTALQAGIARDAYRRYGKGSGHPAKLNFGDCMAYAVAMNLKLPLLFKGDDFRLTDIAPALP